MKKDIILEMPGSTVIDLYNMFQSEHIQIWIDGGWGVDALLGRQTRIHNDLDLIVQQKDLTNFCALLQRLGYKSVEKDDTTSWNFVVANDFGYEIDIHVIHFDDQRNGIYGPIERNIYYPADAFLGQGKINEFPVRCVTAEYQIQSHTGYLLRENDFNDVSALCKQFNIAFPAEYAHLKKDDKSS